MGYYSIIRTPTEFSKVAHQCYRDYILPAKGKRSQSPSLDLSSHLGLVKIDELMDLELSPFQPPYTRDHWVRGSSDYLIEAEARHIPIACSVSGHGSSHLWGLSSLGISLNPQELRIYVLSLWAVLCADGGHSLQEVLTAVRLVGEVMTTTFIDFVSSRTNIMAALSEVSMCISPLGSEVDCESEIGHYHDDFFQYLANEPWFRNLQDQARTEFLKYYRTSGCLNPQKEGYL